MIQPSKYKLKESIPVTRRDNIPSVPLELKSNRNLAELSRETSDRKKLYSMGRIDNPKSIAYKKNQPKEHSVFSQETRSKEEVERANKAVRDAKSSKMLNALPLIYLKSPDKAIGDVLSVFGANKSMNFDTSEKDRQDLAYNSNNPYKSSREKLDYSIKKGLRKVPAAAVNLLLAGEGTGLKGVAKTLNNAVNPLAGSGESLIRARDAIKRGLRGRLTTVSAINDIKRIGKASAIGSAKNEAKETTVDEANKQVSYNENWLASSKNKK